MDNDSNSPADRLEAALKALEANKQAASKAAADMEPELKRLAVLRAQLESLPQTERRAVLDAIGLKHVSAAPKPLTPLTGSSSSQQYTPTALAPNTGHEDSDARTMDQIVARTSPISVSGDEGATTVKKVWTEERKAQARAYRQKHGLKKTAEHYKVSQATISKHIPSEKATFKTIGPWGGLVKK